MEKKRGGKRQTREGGKNTSIKTEIQGYRPRIIVKFHDYIEIPYVDAAERYLDELKIGPWQSLVKEFPGLTMKKLYTVMTSDQISALVERAMKLDREYRPPNLLTYFKVDCSPGTAPELLVNAFSKWPNVQTAYFDPPGSEPLVNPGNDPRFVNQGYLDPAPDGIDAEYAWPRAGGTGFSGGDGSGINLIDLERGWTLNHEDLNAHGAAILHGNIRNGSRAHGTSVLGEICAVDNALGCIGITPAVASVNVVSYWGSTRADAILEAIDNLEFGDVLLLEAQLDPDGGSNWYPIEVLDDEFDTIRLATALGIVVVEAGGNGSNDLDAYKNTADKQILDRNSNDFRDSGAIVVGAASSTVPHTRMGFSNFGSRMDCYAWGENIDTTSSDDTATTNMYTGTFGGTSGASPIITGAALIVQGVAESALGYRFSPRQVREFLSDSSNGTASNNPANDLIGVMPDLKKILQGNVLNLAPDIYLRDFVGDTGDPHSGAISMSPDIILRSATVADPQTEFGEGSGTENNNMLGNKVESGQDNYVYVRIRNRGGSDALNVKATVYWAPVSTLLTSDLWTLVGDVTLPMVQASNVLTVSSHITWPAAAIPAVGHYCFVGLIGQDQDPAPGPADFIEWDNFYRFIRDNNNVTWRNFNVVDNVPDPSVDPKYVALPFLAPGFLDKARYMRINVVARLPRGANVFLELPDYMMDAQAFRHPLMKVQIKKHLVRIPVNPHGKFSMKEIIFPAKSRSQLKLLVDIPKEARGNQYEVYVQQLYKKEEMGRATWRLVPQKRKGNGKGRRKPKG